MKKGYTALATFRERFPSRQDAALVFAACAFPIHIWAIPRLLNEVPAWLVRLSAWDLIGAIAYTLAFTLVETVVVFLILMSLGIVLPARVLRDRLAAQGSMIVFLSSVWAALAHLGLAVLWSNRRLFLAWLLAVLASLAVAYLMIHRSKRLEKVIIALVDRLVPISYIFTCLDIFSIIIIVIRNVSEGVA